MLAVLILLPASEEAYVHHSRWTAGYSYREARIWLRLQLCVKLISLFVRTPILCTSVTWRILFFCFRFISLHLIFFEAPTSPPLMASSMRRCDVPVSSSATVGAQQAATYVLRIPVCFVFFLFFVILVGFYWHARRDANGYGRCCNNGWSPCEAMPGPKTEEGRCCRTKLRADAG